VLPEAALSADHVSTATSSATDWYVLTWRLPKLVNQPKLQNSRCPKDTVVGAKGCQDRRRTIEVEPGTLGDKGREKATDVVGTQQWYRGRDTNNTRLDPLTVTDSTEG
jgi:hypothetical protein